MKRMYMKNHTLTCCVAALILLVSSFAAADEIVHILQKGETLYGISRKYNIPPETIMSFNNLSDPDKLRAGQKLRIPDVYTVKKGDTLYGIARKLGIPVEKLLSANGLSNDTKLKAGENLYIPVISGSSGDGNATAKAQSQSAERKPDAVAVAPVAPAVLSDRKPLEDPRSFEKRKVDKTIIWPVAVKDISYLSGKVYGVSITSVTGEKVKAISSGTVLSVGPYRGFGQVVFLQAKSGYIYVYGGLQEITSRPGENLSFGDEIGNLGTDSLSGKPQLYFMVYNKNIPVDPAKAPRGY
jgi:LysM repeat protein